MKSSTSIDGYPLISRPKRGAIALIVPTFPHHCPTCGAVRLSVIGEEFCQRVATYACGGKYVPDETSSNSRVEWFGCCGKG